jgi:hypothetical protein
MESGVTDEQVIAGLIGSAEYEIVWHIATPAEHIAQLYQDLLGRAPDGAESAYWQIALASGNTAAVVEDIESSSEYLSQLIAQLYETDLDRLPDQSETSYLLDLFGDGDTNEEVTATLVGSAEFLADSEALGGSNDSLRMLEFQREIRGVPEPPALWLLTLGMVCLAELYRFRSAENNSDSHPPLSLAIGGWKARPMSHGK